MPAPRRRHPKATAPQPVLPKRAGDGPGTASTFIVPRRREPGEAGRFRAGRGRRRCRSPRCRTWSTPGDAAGQRTKTLDAAQQARTQSALRARQEAIEAQRAAAERVRQTLRANAPRCASAQQPPAATRIPTPRHRHRKAPWPHRSQTHPFDQDAAGGTAPQPPEVPAVSDAPDRQAPAASRRESGDQERSHPRRRPALPIRTTPARDAGQPTDAHGVESWIADGHTADGHGTIDLGGEPRSCAGSTRITPATPNPLTGNWSVKTCS